MRNSLQEQTFLKGKDRLSIVAFFANDVAEWEQLFPKLFL
jgi:hypothetical protein